jgi:hypothetical protein
MSNELALTNQYKSELEYAREFAKMVVGTGKWNKDWNIDTVSLLSIYAGSLGIHPVQAVMTGFDIIQGKITMKPQQMSALIRKHGHSLKVMQYDDKCVIDGKRRDTGDTMTTKYTIEDAKKAELFGKDNWKKHLHDMLYSRAMGRMGRMLFADVIGGAYCEGEIDEDDSKKSIPKIKEETITIETIDMETGEYPQEVVTEYTLEDLHAKVLVGTIEELTDYVRFVSITKSITDQETIKWLMESEKSMKVFRENLTKRIEKSENEETTEA